MVQTPIKSLSLAAFLAQPETEPASEYLDSRISQKPIPQGKHSFLQSELAALINAALRPQRIARAATELRCTFGNRSLVPNISSWRSRRRLASSQHRCADLGADPPRC